MHDQLRAEMQSQIDQLKLQLSNSIAQLQEAQQHAAAANAASNEGRGFSRAVNRPVRLTALAAEVRFSRHLGRSHRSPLLRSPQTTAKTYLRG